MYFSPFDHGLVRTLLLIGICSFALTGQTPNDGSYNVSFNAEATGDRYGHSVAVSDGGASIAIGGFFNDTGGSNAGHVRVFSYGSEGWRQLGEDIDGAAATELLGTSVALNGSAERVVVGGSGGDENGQDAGVVRVYDLTFPGEDWQQVGGDIIGEFAGNLAGNAVAITSAGDVVAVAEFGYEDFRGQVRTFRLENGEWMAFGGTLRGVEAGDDFGISIDLSHDGAVLAVGASSISNNRPGTVRTYELLDGEWAQAGNALTGGGTDGFGESISLSADGNMLAVGAPLRNNSRGKFQVYTFEGDNWAEFGETPEGSAEGDSYGFKVALGGNSGSGLEVAVSAPRNGAGGLNAGAVSVLFYDAEVDRWFPDGDPLLGEPFGQFGLAMDYASTGDALVVGSEFLINDETVGGQVRTYDYGITISIEVVTTEREALRVFPNPTDGSQVTLTVPAALRNGRVQLLDAAGRLMISQPVAAGELATDNLPGGAYLLRVTTDAAMQQTTLIVR